MYPAKGVLTNISYKKAKMYYLLLPIIVCIPDN
jgi:hypothetical protein